MTKIEWTGRSDWNPIRGCTRISPGCENCYSEGIAARFSGPGKPFEGFAEMTPHGPRWTRKVALIEGRLALPLRWRKPSTIFVNSASDLFHESVPDEWIDLVFAVMALCPQHTFQCLTKRADRMRRYFSGPWDGDPVFARIADATFNFCPRGKLPSGFFGKEVPIGPSIGGDYNNPEFGWRRFLNIGALPNIWLGVSAEDQKRANERIPDLLATPAAVRFVSCEPLLGPLDIEIWLRAWSRPSLDWVIVGGESGSGARDNNFLDNARAIQRQCAEWFVPFFGKQGVGKTALPDDLNVREWPKQMERAA